MPAPHVLDTFSGARLDLDDPRPDQIRIEDIASALSKICRFGAQATRFHSVAQHALLVTTFVSDALGRPDLALAALHHDSHEAYACDIPRPLKLKLRAGANLVYEQTCERLDVAIAGALGVRELGKEAPGHDVVDRADDMALIVRHGSFWPGAPPASSRRPR